MTDKTPELDFNGELLDETLDYLIEKARDDFYIFVRLLASEILPEEFVDGNHLRVICNELQEVEDSVANPRKKPGRLQLFLPPGSMKSKLASNLFPAWCMGRHPNWCFLAIGSSTNFAVDNFGRPTKDVVDLPQYKSIFPETELRGDVASAGRWDTTKKGRFVVAGATTGIAGRRAHISICDDVMNEQTGDTDRKKINRWYQKGLRTRLLPKGAEIIINTRWHLEDLSGSTMAQDGWVNPVTGEKKLISERPWRIISIPALCDENTHKLLWKKGDPKEKYAEGTSFWPEFWPTDVLIEKKDSMLPSEWNALYMQTPTADEGNIVKRDYWTYWDGDKPPACKHIILSVDTAFSTSETADFSAYTLWGAFDYYDTDDSFSEEQVKKDAIILLGAEKERWTFPELCEKIQSKVLDKEVDFLVIEQKASGQSLIQEMQRQGMPVVPFMPDKDKMSRLYATTPYFQSGKVFVPKNRQWAEEVMEEVCTFPYAPHDDLTDTVSQAIIWLRDTFYLSNENHPEPEGWAERAYKKQKRKSYWSCV